MQAKTRWVVSAYLKGCEPVEWTSTHFRGATTTALEWLHSCSHPALKRYGSIHQDLCVVLEHPIHGIQARVSIQPFA